MKNALWNRYLPIIVMLLNSVACGTDKDHQMQDKTEHKYTNHLIDENSPYLLSHAHNPVNWYPWGEAALEKAKAEDKVIFLSIGYSACHWCHVMERESFENDSIAAVLNEHFVAIKVDREQRPDLDEIYMSFTQAMTGGGGWPMSVFLTPDLKPFFAGTYFPPVDRYGRPGFKSILTKISDAYKNNKQAVLTSAGKIFDRVNSTVNRDLVGGSLSPNAVEQAAKALMRNFDNVNGGFGNQPKFPHALELSLFLRHFKNSGDQTYLVAAEKALTAMAQGGIYDHVGGGFARYSTDAKWLVPHFEKMLYDNGMLVPVYAEAYQLTGKDIYLHTVTHTLDFVLRELHDDNGGFYSALDADSEGEEGKFYVWSKAEIDKVVDTDIDRFGKYYNITERGNFEGHNILNITASSGQPAASFPGSLEKLLQARAVRVRPMTDDKILVSWNGLMLSAMCRGYQITGDKKYLNAAIANAEFVEKELLDDGRLTHSYREGRHSEGQFLEDYGYYLRGLLDLYQSDVDQSGRWLKMADKLARNAVEHFLAADGHLYMRPQGNNDLIFRPRNETDGALPSPGSFLISSLLQMHRLTEDKFFYNSAERALRALSGMIASAPGSMASAALATDYFFSDKIEIVIVGKGDALDDMLRATYSQYLPGRLIAVSSDGKDGSPLFEGRQSDNDETVAYVCRNSVCNLPVTDLNEFKKQLSQLK